ncbi:endolytic transglycosylase MltG [Candidatus Coxiella mudrowiae]|uniref:endolytic transglycosylase MltG n=1 Tax=Candidatus Coxiella mudrowiae TaxID=2054173 RepID=UPI0024680EAC|nr:endolytic transglycosylase MltG [Candidatus Coxiella mudrowiae]
MKKAWQSRSKNLPYKNSYQALIVASLTEKETVLSKESLEIAGVILRRLKKRMPLQVDPTVLYGLGRPYDKPDY